MAAGIGLSRWFGQEAKRVYAMLAEDEADQDTRELVERIERLGGTIPARELKRHARRYRTVDQADAALQDLVDRGFGYWIVCLPGEQGGRPTRAFVLRSVAKTPAKHEENGGFGNSNTNGDGTEPDDWGEV
jgi:hypothetical protein